jgi:cobalt-precorrin 5A hydrolase/precorrin-3B C17-methyltransferase
MAGGEAMSAERSIALGIGCDRAADEWELKTLVSNVLKANDILVSEIACIATIEGKKHEPAIHALSRELDVPLCLFSADTLNREGARITTRSDLVRGAVGTPSVSEAAALAAAGADALLLVAKQKSAHCTAALAISTSRNPDGKSTSRLAEKPIT